VTSRLVLVASLLASNAVAAPPQGSVPDLDAVLAEEVSILDALDRMVFEARSAELSLRAAQQALSECEARREAVARLLQAARQRELEARTRLRTTLRLLASTPGTDPFSAILFGDADDTATRRRAFLKRLAARQGLEASAYLQALRAAEDLDFRAGIERANAFALARAASDAQQRIEQETVKRRALLKALEQDRALAMRHAREVDRAQQELVRVVTERLSSAPAAVDFERLRGRMRVPIAGARVAIPFGDQVHPQFKTVVPHPGVTLAYEAGSRRNVRAVAFGRVVFAGPMRGYGNTVVVDHASGYYTVYAGLATVAVQQGAIVRDGDILGEVARAPGDPDLRLYFEIRHGRTAMDPAGYFPR